MMITKQVQKNIAALSVLAQSATEAAGRNDERLALSDLALMVWSANQSIELLVTGLRREGATWAAIGELLGVSRQAAQQRFGE
jgi:hypothetical protein